MRYACSFRTRSGLDGGPNHGMSIADRVWIGGEIGTVVVRTAGRCVAELESGWIAVIRLAESADDPHPWITKVVSIDVFEPRAGALRPVVADDARVEALAASLISPGSRSTH